MVVFIARLLLGLVVPIAMLALGTAGFVIVSNFGLDSYFALTFGSLVMGTAALAAALVLLVVQHQLKFSWASWLRASATGALLLGFTMWLPLIGKRLLETPISLSKSSLEELPMGAGVMVGVQYNVPDWVLMAINYSPLVITVIATILVYSWQERAHKSAGTRLNK